MIFLIHYTLAQRGEHGHTLLPHEHVYHGATLCIGIPRREYMMIYTHNEGLLLIFGLFLQIFLAAL